jgi:hypothetical protein
LRGEHEQVAKAVDTTVKRKKEEKQRDKDTAATKRQRLGIGSTSNAPSNQPSIKSSFQKMQKYDPEGAVQQQYDQALVELLSCNMLSFNLVDSPEFHKFVNLLDKNINLKSRYTYSIHSGMI